MADTSARPEASSAARYRCRMSPRAGTAISAPASSIRRPTIRSARSPRRHRPSMSAGAGNCSRPAATTYAGRSRSARVRRCAADGEAPLRNRDNVKTPANGALNGSRAACCNHVRSLAGFRAGNPGIEDICATLAKYRTFPAAVQQRFYGRSGLVRLPF